jgi:hypothetical protein
VFTKFLLTFSAALAAAALSANLTSDAKAAKVRPIWHPELRTPVELADPAYGFSGEQASASTGAVSALAAAWGVAVCAPEWHYVAAKPNSFVIGNCLGSWPVDLSSSSFDSVNEWTWFGSYIGGSYNGCGWMRVQDLADIAGGTGTSCGTREYCTYIHCENGVPIVYGSTTDGLDAQRLSGPNCTEWANLRPWSQNGSPTNAVNTSVPAGRIKIRYPSAYIYSGHRYYMVRDTKVPANSGNANWVFLRDDCFA